MGVEQLDRTERQKQALTSTGQIGLKAQGSGLRAQGSGCRRRATATAWQGAVVDKSRKLFEPEPG